jgi:hypothetical protein
VAVLERELAARPDDARLQKQLAGEKAKLPAQVRKLKIADEQIEPGDYPEDLDQKAARLRKSENELLAEILRAETRASTLRKQVKLAKSNTRARTGDLFHDGEKSRKGHGANSESRGGAAPAADADSGGGGGAGGAGGAPAGEQPPPADPGFTDDEANQGLDASPTPGAVPIPQDVGVDVTVQYQGVIDQSELDSLRRDQKSSDPEVRARVAERLAAALKARAERVKKQRQAIENRAKQLRGK